MGGGGTPADAVAGDAIFLRRGNGGNTRRSVFDSCCDKKSSRLGDRLLAESYRTVRESSDSCEILRFSSDRVLVETTPIHLSLEIDFFLVYKHITRFFRWKLKLFSTSTSLVPTDLTSCSLLGLYYSTRFDFDLDPSCITR